MLRSVLLAVAVVPFACVSGAHAVDIQTVSVGNPGNAGELSGDGTGDEEGIGPDRICGAVGYTYNIGKYEVTAGQYAEFLNAVAGVDTYGLYRNTIAPHGPDDLMWSHSFGCKIERFDGSGTENDPYQYRVAVDWANRPVNFVSWGDAARFANWLHNGQPTGVQNLTTTEDGSYYLNGATDEEDLIAVTREPDATWVIPSEDEWYKAAYHYNDGVTGNYFDYPTSSDSPPSNDLVDPDPGNNATFAGTYGPTIGIPYNRTELGAHENSESPYRTFDQGGNVWEWNETIIDFYVRRVRGGAFSHSDLDLHAANRRFSVCHRYESSYLGFRVAEVPETKSDIDFDGDVDLHDYDLLQDADLHDYALLQTAFTGPQ